MEGPRQPDLPAGLHAGRLEGVHLPDLIWALSQREVTGLLRITRNRVCKTLYFRDGHIIFACSGDPNDRLGEMLLRQGRIRLNQLEQALPRLGEGKRLGTVLVEIGSLKPDVLVEAVVDQLETIVLDLLTWDEGEYELETGDLPSEEVITLQAKTSELLLKGIRNITSFTRIRSSVGVPRTVYGLTDKWHDALRGLALTEGEQMLVDRLRKGDESIENLCREIYLSNFEIYQALWAFKTLGVVQEKEWRKQTHQAASGAGRFEQGGFAELLVRVARSGECGVLYVSRRAVERSFHIRDGRCVFATSSDPDDGLINYLLHRGVISLSDREETAKRLLSNKRVGTILREMGVIDDNDLREMVRAQLSEIVFDTFGWDGGEYAFVPGPLPSIEEITLNVSIERLVAEGLRRVTSWTRVIQGCGGMDAPLVLTRRYEDLLDAMGAGVEEWQVVNVLTAPKSPRRVCRMTELADFRACQILWTLRLIGGLEIGSVEELDDVKRPLSAPPDDPAEEAGPLVSENAPIEAPDIVLANRPAIEAADEPVVPARPEPPRPTVAEQPPEKRPWEKRSPAVEPPPSGVSDESSPVVVREASARGSDERSPVAVPETVPASPGDEEPDAIEIDGDSTGDLEATLKDLKELPDRFARSEVEPDPPAPQEATAEALPEQPEVREKKAKPAKSTWPGPPNLDNTISRFNAMHRLVYRAVRAEIGAGAANFVRSCCGEVGPDSTNIVEEVELLSDGSWDAEGLKRVVIEGHIEDPWPLYQEVLDREFVLLQVHLDEAKAVALKQQIWELNRARRS